MPVSVYMILVGITSFLVALKIVPQVIALAADKGLFDIPGGRKGHHLPTPTAGGIAIFLGVSLSMLFWASAQGLAELKLLMFGIVTLFFVGLKDDLAGVPALVKFAVQILLALILVSGGFLLDDFWGMLGLSQLPIPLKYTVSIFFIVLLTNAYNLIDGIDGLAGSIGLIAAFTFGLIFAFRGEVTLSLLAFSLVGSLLGFLKYNFQPARIFMGDTGSLVIGFALSALAIRLLEGSATEGAALAAWTPAIVLATLSVPLADTCQVIISRLADGVSPLMADRRHVHHMLLRLGCSHATAALLLCGVTFCLILIVPLVVCGEAGLCFLRIAAINAGLIGLLKMAISLHENEAFNRFINTH